MVVFWLRRLLVSERSAFIQVPFPHNQKVCIIYVHTSYNSYSVHWFRTRREGNVEYSLCILIYGTLSQYYSAAQNFRSATPNACRYYVSNFTALQHCGTAIKFFNVDEKNFLHINYIYYLLVCKS